VNGQKIPDADRSALFLSYHGADRETVSRISTLLEARGLSTFLDRKDLIAGLPWPEALEQALAGARAVAVFLGGEGLGAWQKREMWFALDRQAQADQAGASFPVIPVLLPGADPTAGFLSLNTWIDLRDDPVGSAALDLLARAVLEGIGPRAGKTVSSLCPYRGLEPFGEEDAAFFCGREAFSKRLLEAVLTRSFVAVIGPSGSGKSSVVRAGLLPRLRRQRPPAPAWDAVLFTPGERPWHRLAVALMPLLEPTLSEVDHLIKGNELGDALASGSMPLEDALRRVLEKSRGTGRLLLVADQFEELFTLAAEASRKPFVESLLELTAKLPVTFALTLRADFFDRALTVSRVLSDRLEDLINLGPMRRDELALAIREPAERVGLTFEPGLVDRILDDVGDEPGNLPLLEFALTGLWVRRSEGRLTNGAYTEIGGVAGAIAQKAETEFTKLTPQQGVAAQRIFTRLVRVARPEDGGRDTRRRAGLADLDRAGREVVNRLADRETRLLVTARNESGESVVEVAHEALIQGWGRLQLWLKEDREFLLWREVLRAHLADHERNAALLSGASLAEAERWLKERRQDLNVKEVSLIETSIDARRMQGRRRRMALAGVFAAALVAVLGVIAVWQWVKERQEANEARMRLILTAQDDDPAVIALLAIEADKIHAPRTKASPEAVQFARYAAKGPLPLAIVGDPENEVQTAAFSPDGSRVVAGSEDGTARIWRADGSGGPIVLRGHRGTVWIAAFSGDGSRIVTGAEDGTACIWKADGSGDPIVLREREDQSPLQSAVFSPDDSRIVTASVDGTVTVWKADGSGKPIVLLWGKSTESRLHFDPRHFLVMSVSFSPDSKRVIIVPPLIGDTRNTRIYNADGSGKPVDLIEGDRLRAAAFTSDSRIIAVNRHGIVQRWNTDGIGKPEKPFGGGLWGMEQGFALSAAFSRDDSRVLLLISRGSDDSVTILNADGSGSLELPEPRARSAAFRTCHEITSSDAVFFRGKSV
jgi:WD40 repeat protein